MIEKHKSDKDEDSQIYDKLSLLFFFFLCRSIYLFLIRLLSSAKTIRRAATLMLTS